MAERIDTAAMLALALIHGSASSRHFTSGFVARPTWVMLRRPSRSSTSITFWYCVWVSPRSTTGNSGVSAFC